MTQLGKLQGLLDGLVAAGAPGVAAWIQDEDGSLQAPVASRTPPPAGPWRPGCASEPAA
jgi:hypothetical protein